MITSKGYCYTKINNRKIMKVKKKILIVDDEPGCLEMFKARLEASGYEVVCASGGRQGLELAEKDKPDLILLDIFLPDIGGFKVCRDIKSNEATKNIKVVICTNKLSDVDAEQAVKSGADEFIEKMSDSKILLNVVSNLTKD
ncbi:two-component system response regulator [Candidatus Omnitrophota bacterium]